MEVSCSDNDKNILIKIDTPDFKCNEDSNKKNIDDIWSDEDQTDDATLLDNFAALFNINTYIYYENPVQKINKKLGSIIFLYKNKKYKAQYSIEYPKIIYNNDIFDNLNNWVKYIKNIEKKKSMFDFITGSHF